MAFDKELTPKVNSFSHPMPFHFPAGFAFDPWGRLFLLHQALDRPGKAMAPHPVSFGPDLEAARDFSRVRPGSQPA